MTRKIRVLLADDHETVREGLRLLLEAQADMEVVDGVGDGLSAIQRARELRPDVVVMDVSMPGLNGLKATRQLAETCPEVHVVTLTRHAEEGYMDEILRAGGAGYVLKQSAATELLRAIRAVAGGARYLDSALSSRVFSRFARQPRHAEATRPLITERETEVLRMIAWGHSNKEIAARLDLSVKTIEVHKANALKKLGLRSRIDLVRYALIQGWLQDA
jgi:DNA-binding NarL/FixJ family response regulator